MKWNKRIRDLREDHDMTQDELADKLNISKRTLLRYESGISEPTIGILISLSLIFNVSIDYIAGVKDSDVIEEESIKEQLNNLINYIEKIKSNI
jgi:transcriptional regulator with XRE-family HTH domain